MQIENILDELLQNKITRPEASALLVKESVADTNLEIDLHLCAANALRRYEVLKQVQSVHRSFVAGRNFNQETKMQPQRGIIAKMNPKKWIAGIAASVVIIAASWFVYQYSTTSSSTLYAEIYQPYNINTDRGMGDIKTHNMVQEFKQNKYDAVIKTFESLAVTNNREKFLAGYAYQQAGNYKQSLVVFQQLLKHNQQTNTRLYNDEAEFYSGLAYLKLKDNRQAAGVFEGIRKNPNHTFYERINEWTITRLKWLK